MDMLMLFASMGAKTLQTVTFNANATWVAPAGVNLLPSVIGHGVNGTADSTTTRTTAAMTVVFHATGSGTDPDLNDWSNVQGVVDSAIGIVDAGGFQTFNTGRLDKYANGTETLTTGSSTVNAVAATAAGVYSGGWHTSGPITNSGTGSVQYTSPVAGTTGASATGFGFTFAGGTPTTPTAATTTNSNVSVTPAASYTIVVPAGATIQITYYA